MNFDARHSSQILTSMSSKNKTGCGTGCLGSILIIALLLYIGPIGWGILTVLLFIPAWFIYTTFIRPIRQMKKFTAQALNPEEQPRTTNPYHTRRNNANSSGISDDTQTDSDVIDVENINK